MPGLTAPYTTLGCKVLSIRGIHCSNSSFPLAHAGTLANVMLQKGKSFCLPISATHSLQSVLFVPCTSRCQKATMPGFPGSPARGPLDLEMEAQASTVSCPCVTSWPSKDRPWFHSGADIPHSGSTAPHGHSLRALSTRH